MKKIYITTILALILILSFSLLVSSEEGFSENGNWYYNVEEDPMSDEVTIGFTLNDEDNMGQNFTSYEADTIFIRKLPGSEPELFVVWSDYLADNNKVRWRFDKGEVNTGSWNMSQDGTALFFPGNSAELKDFVKKILQAEQLAIEVKPYEKTREASVFKPAGLGEVLLPYLDKMGWEELESVIQ